MSITAPLSPRRTAGDDRRSEIVRAAREVIVEKGVEGLRTRDIAERVGINIATLHYHVPTKEAVIELVADSLGAQFEEQHLTRPRDNFSASDQLDHEFSDFREIALDRPETMLVFSELMERARRDARIAEAILPLKRRWRQTLVDLLEAGVAEGAFRADLDAGACATIIMSSMIGFCRTPSRSAETYGGIVAELRRAIHAPSSARTSP